MFRKFHIVYIIMEKAHVLNEDIEKYLIQFLSTKHFLNE